MLLSMMMLPMMGSFISNWTNKQQTNKGYMWMSMMMWMMSLYMWMNYDGNNTNGLESMEEMGGMMMGMDGMSLYLMLLTTMLTMFMLLMTNDNELGFWMLMSEGMLMGVFSVLDMLYFYMLFEMTLMPLYYMMSNSMKTYKYSKSKMESAMKKLLGYTLLGSFMMLLGMMYLYKMMGNTNYLYLMMMNTESMNMLDNEKNMFSMMFWMSWFMAFAMKMPMMPFHVWLPEAHSEAPTGGSMLLAGMMLKMGTYGMLSYLMGMFPNTTKMCKEYVEMMMMMSMMYSVMNMMSQIEMKKLMAYSSISHMNLCLLGLFSNDFEGMLGGYMMMMNHGLISGALFLSAGILFNSYSLSAMKYYSGLFISMPLFSILFFILNLSNMGFPPFASFISEILMFTGSFKNNFIISFLASFSIIFSGVYGIWFITSIMYGKPKNGLINDLTRKEFLILFTNLILSLFLGIFPQFFIDDLILPLSLLV